MTASAFLTLGSQSDAMPWVDIVIGLFGGLALFLFGMDQMTAALKGAAGAGMRAVLSRFTRNRVAGVVTGTLVTAATQSSSVTTVLLVGFVSAGLMSLQQSVGVIMGANIGSTFTAQIIAFNVTKYALAIVTLGFVMMFGGRREKVRRYGAIVMGLGMVFFGMKLMGDAMGPLRDYEPFIDLMKRMDVVVLGVLAGAVFTAVVQSSAATTGLVIILAAQGYLTLEAGIAIALGANIGTCATALLATIGKPREALQVAIAHVQFNVIGVLLWLPFIGLLAQWVRGLSDDPARQIANAHTLFNVINVALFLPFTGVVAAAIGRLIPAPAADERVLKARYLDPELLPTPALALDRLRMELGHMGRTVLTMFERMAPTLGRSSAEDLARVAELDHDVDALHEQIVQYAAQLGRIRLSRDEERRLGDWLSVANYLENLGDSIETNMVAIGRQRMAEGVVISAPTAEKLYALYESVHGAIEQLTESLEADEPDLAMKVIRRKAEVRELAHAVIDHLGRRLVADAPNRVQTYHIEQGLIEQLRRMYYFARHAAWHVVGRDQPTPEDHAE